MTVEASNRQASGGKPLRIFEITLVTYAFYFLSSRMRLSAYTCHLLLVIGFAADRSRGLRIRGSHSPQEWPHYLG